MKKIIFALLLTSTPVFAQQQNPAQEQIERFIGSLVIQNTTLANQLQQATAKITELEKQLKTAAPVTPVTPPVPTK